MGIGHDLKASLADAGGEVARVRGGCIVRYAGGRPATIRKYGKGEIALAPPGVYRIANPETDSERADRVVRIDRATLYLPCSNGEVAYVEAFSPAGWKADTLFERVEGVTSFSVEFP